ADELAAFLVHGGTSGRLDVWMVAGIKRACARLQTSTHRLSTQEHAATLVVPSSRRCARSRRRRSNMLYMVVERFKDGAAPEVYRRARDKGRMIPDGHDGIPLALPHP